MTLQEFATLFSKLPEIQSQRVYEEMYPFAFLAAAIFNVNRRKGRPPFKPEDFITKPKPKKPQEKEESSSSQFLEILKSWGVSLPNGSRSTVG